MTMQEWEQRVDILATAIIADLLEDPGGYYRRPEIRRQTQQDLKAVFEAVAVTYPGGELDKEHAWDTNRALLDGLFDDTSDESEARNSVNVKKGPNADAPAKGYVRGHITGA